MLEFFLTQKFVSIRRLVVVIALSVVVWLTSSCATRGFKEAAAVNLELRFYRWDSVCITKPDTRKDGFIPVLNAAEVSQEINQLNVPRDLATVVVGSCYYDWQAAEIATEWNKRLTAQGFRRVVVLRGGEGAKLNGLPIIADFASFTLDEGPRLARTEVAIPATP